jgi:hypothetical protein
MVLSVLLGAELETVAVQVLAAKLRTLRAGESPLPRKAGRSPDRGKIRVAARRQVCAFTT